MYGVWRDALDAYPVEGDVAILDGCRAAVLRPRSARIGDRMTQGDQIVNLRSGLRRKASRTFENRRACDAGFCKLKTPDPSVAIFVFDINVGGAFDDRRHRCDHRDSDDHAKQREERSHFVDRIDDTRYRGGFR